MSAFRLNSAEGERLWVLNNYSEYFKPDMVGKSGSWPYFLHGIKSELMKTSNVYMVDSPSFSEYEDNGSVHHSVGTLLFNSGEEATKYLMELSDAPLDKIYIYKIDRKEDGKIRVRSAVYKVDKWYGSLFKK